MRCTGDTQGELLRKVPLDPSKPFKKGQEYPEAMDKRFWGGEYARNLLNKVP